MIRKNRTSVVLLLVLLAAVALGTNLLRDGSGRGSRAFEPSPRIQSGLPQAGQVAGDRSSGLGENWHIEANGVMWRYADHFGVSPRVAKLPLSVAGSPVAEDEEEAEILFWGLDQPDPVVQRTFHPTGALSPAAMPTPIITFAGIPFRNGFPPDTNGEVGPNHYVQSVNSAFAVYNKSGTVLAGPTDINQLWQTAGGPCFTAGAGDPIVLYDQLADRWLISQFTARPGPFYECIAISQTPDPAGAYYVYSFLTNQTDFEDYPHLGMWPDGYYAGFHEFGAAGYNGARPFVFERSRMLVGNPQARMQTNARADNSSNGLMPADLDGTTLPPTGAPNPFTDVGGDGKVRHFKYRVNWENPAGSQWTGPVDMPSAPFTRLCPGSDDCIPQQGTERKLDGVSPRPMFRAAYRNFGTHESLVLNFNVDAGGGQAAPRWFELRGLSSGTPTLHQEGTYAPNAEHRWLGSAAMDRQGNLAIGYSASSATIFPQIRYAGRLVDDPLGQLAQGEALLIAGTAAQTEENRWGDYSDLTVDPADDCTFWYTTEYVESAAANWTTRIGAFKFDGCSPNAPTPTPGPPTNTPTSTPTDRTPTPEPEPTQEVIAENEGEFAFQDGGTITSSVTITNGPIIESIDVLHIAITHTNPDDLDVFLISPSGLEIELFTDVCGGEDWSTASTRFNLSDQALDTIGDVCPPGQGTYDTEGGLSLFEGEPSSGVWRLEITDDNTGETGVLDNWGLRIRGAAGGNPSPTRTPQSTPTAMPSASVTSAPSGTATATARVSATSVPPATTTPVACTLQFTDVPTDNAFYANIRCLACGGILGGYSDGTFRPNNNITRGQIAKVVSNAAGYSDAPGAPIFEDVSANNTFFDWVQRLARRGHMGGYTCGGPNEPCGTGNKPYFRPFANATRGQLAKIVSNAALFNDPQSGQTFTDVPTSSPFHLWIERLASRGVMGGYGCGRPSEPCDAQNRPYFRPNNDVTRGQASKIVANTFYPNCRTSASRR